MPRGPNGEKRPADVIGAAVMMAEIATGEIEDTKGKAPNWGQGWQGRWRGQWQEHKQCVKGGSWPGAPETGGAAEPVAPFLTADILAGLDGFFQARLLAEFKMLPEERRAKALPFIAAWCGRAEKLRAIDAARNLALVILMREKAVEATEPYDFLISPTSPITAYSAEEATPGSDPMRPFEHIGFTAPFNMSEQPAASICTGYDADGLPIGLQIVGHRFDDLGVLRVASAYDPELRVWSKP